MNKWKWHVCAEIQKKESLWGVQYQICLLVKNIWHSWCRAFHFLAANCLSSYVTIYTGHQKRPSVSSSWNAATLSTLKAISLDFMLGFDLMWKTVKKTLWAFKRAKEAATTLQSAKKANCRSLMSLWISTETLGWL